MTGGNKTLKLQKTLTAAKPNPGAWEGCRVTAKPIRDHETRHIGERMIIGKRD